MMGASFNNWASSDWLANYIKHSRFTWQQRFIWLPKRSHVSKQRIWLKRAWYGTKYVNGPAGEHNVKLERWLTNEEYMWNQLTSAD